MLTSVAPNGTPPAPAPAREYICVPIDDKWEPRVGDELRAEGGERQHRRIIDVYRDGFSFDVGGAIFVCYRGPGYHHSMPKEIKCFRPVLTVPPTITMPFDESTIDEIRRAKNLSPVGAAIHPAVTAPQKPAIPSTDDMRRAIDAECGAISVMLQGKNRAYGNSIADPIKVFSKADADERINVRLDDKISRLVHGKPDDNEDAELDLIGYLILRRAKRRAQGKVAV